MSKLNIELFKKIRQRIAEAPESYDQDTFVDYNERSPCGTSACLAGEAIICNAPSVVKGIVELRDLDMNYSDDYAVARRATDLLGLSGDFGEYAHSLDNDRTAAGEAIIFDGGGQGWPEPYRSMFQNDKTAAVIAYLDHIIETGKVLE